MSIHDRGFASLPPTARSAISSKGGYAAHQSGHAHEWTVKTARKAGKLGGMASGVTRRRKRDEAKRLKEERDAGLKP
jgi:hypothetical protein